MKLKCIHEIRFGNAFWFFSLGEFFHIFLDMVEVAL